MSSPTMKKFFLLPHGSCRTVFTTAFGLQSPRAWFTGLILSPSLQLSVNKPQAYWVQSRNYSVVLAVMMMSSALYCGERWEVLWKLTHAELWEAWYRVQVWEQWTAGCASHCRAGVRKCTQRGLWVAARNKQEGYLWQHDLFLSDKWTTATRLRRNISALKIWRVKQDGHTWKCVKCFSVPRKLSKCVYWCDNNMKPYCKWLYLEVVDLGLSELTYSFLNTGFETPCSKKIVFLGCGFNFHKEASLSFQNKCRIQWWYNPEIQTDFSF